MSGNAQAYEISRRIAVGDAGLVYLGTERATGRAVVMKLLLPDDQIAHPLDLEALRRDAPGIALMEGENIVRLLDAFQDDDGTALIYEFAEGTGGLDVPNACPVSAEEAVEVAAQLLTALCCGENQQYPHGDLKPSAITLGQSFDGRRLVKVLDWGLANYRNHLTPAALPFAAPERLAGAPPSPAADLFSAGTVLFYLFTGQRPVEADRVEEATVAWQHFDPLRLGQLRPDLPPALLDGVARLLNLDPSQRPASAGEALAMLAAPGPSRTISVPPPPVRAGSRTVILRPAPTSPVPPAAAGAMMRGGQTGRTGTGPQRKDRSTATVAIAALLTVLAGGTFAIWKYSQSTGARNAEGKAMNLAQSLNISGTPQNTPPSPSPAVTKAPPAVVVTAATPALEASPATTAPRMAATGGTASFSSRAEPPAVDSADIANFAPQTGSDKWFFESGKERYGADAAKGITFTTGAAPVLFKALTYKIAAGAKKSATPANPTTWNIRLGTLSGNSFKPIASKQAQQTADTGVGDYITWTLATPVPLEPNTTYAIDVGMRSRTPWSTGIPYLATSKKVTAPGVGICYSTGNGGKGAATISPSGKVSRVFHIDLFAQ